MKNKSSPLVSVIINCYNGQKYLEESIKSVINQTYKNWEIIFWDNNSNDNSRKILKSFKDKRIKYFYSKQHNTLYKARNLAIKKSKGKFICFLDTDDKWLKNKLKIQITKIKKYNFDVIFSNYFIKKEKNKNKFLATDQKKFLNYKNLTQELLDHYFLGILTVMVRRKLFLKKKFNPRYQIIGDFDYFLNLSLKHKFFYIKNPLAVYRIHSENFSKKKINLHIKELSTWLKSQKIRLKGYNMSSIKRLILKLKIKSYLALGYKILGV